MVGLTAEDKQELERYLIQAIEELDGLDPLLKSLCDADKDKEVLKKILKTLQSTQLFKRSNKADQNQGPDNSSIEE